MMMIADAAELDKPFEEAVNELTALGEELGVQVKWQREDIFNKMHRI